jgi:hypothetical protein
MGSREKDHKTSEQVETMSQSLFNYDEMVQNALRGVVREILQQVVDHGLPGAHHFYIAFRTRAPGVMIPRHLQERYPDDMTIVVQHRFWGLEVHDDHFVIGLSFNHKPERLEIPFAAVVGFVDPSVQFALQFQDDPIGEDEAHDDDGAGDMLDFPAFDAVTSTDSAANHEDEADPKAPGRKPGKSSKSPKAAPNKNTAKSKSGANKTDETGGKSGGDDNVVTLDAFRKKP